MLLKGLIATEKMMNFSRNIEKLAFRKIEKQIIVSYSNAPQGKTDEFRPLNLKNVKSQAQTQRRAPRKNMAVPPRTNQMPVDQDWSSVWPGPRSFHPATVPLPIRQGFSEKEAPPGKFANAELMKIPNFLHLTPPVIKKQCEALKKFCTPWPKALNSLQKIEKHFPIEVTSSDYCHSSPTIRDPMARIVTVKFKLAVLGLDDRAKDKFLRLVGERYDQENDTVTIVTDRCPLKKQNYDYAMYLITALFHESKKIEPWEEMKTEADMEYYHWENNVSKKSIEAIFGTKSNEIPNIEVYSKNVSEYMNEGENDYTIKQYAEGVRKVLGLPNSS